MKRLIAVLLLLPSVAFADWQTTLEGTFPGAVVETFDNLQDWTPQAQWSGDYRIPVNERPKYINGGAASRWGYYADNNTLPMAGPVITNHGAGTSVTGKSAMIGHRPLQDTSTTMRGAPHLGIYWGDGTPTSGHRNAYVFYRFRIPRNHFPTATSGGGGTGVFTHVQGQDIKYIGYEKFHSILPGFTDHLQWNYLETANMPRSPYGAGTITRNLIVEGGSPGNGAVERIATVNYLNPGGDLKYEYSAYAWPRLYDYGHQPVPLDAWGAVETHITMRSPKCNDSIEVFRYDVSGNSTRVGGADNLCLQENDTHAINAMFFGGNVSADAYGEGMDNAYYVDDLVVSDQRVGPAYFTALAAYQSGNLSCYPDGDGDLYPGSLTPTVEATCGAGRYESWHFTAMTLDCTDSDATINPGSSDPCKDCNAGTVCGGGGTPGNGRAKLGGSGILKSSAGAAGRLRLQ